MKTYKAKVSRFVGANEVMLSTRDNEWKNSFPLDPGVQVQEGEMYQIQVDDNRKPWAITHAEKLPDNNNYQAPSQPASPPAGYGHAPAPTQAAAPPSSTNKELLITSTALLKQLLTVEQIRTNEELVEYSVLLAQRLIDTVNRSSGDIV